MAAIIVMMDMEGPGTAEVLSGGVALIGAPPRQVHAAPADPDIPGDPGPRTFCGLDTGHLVQDDWHPQSPASPWFPPKWHNQVCKACHQALMND